MPNKTDLDGARILVVDDQPANLDLLCELLERRGCDVMLAPTGAAALRIAPRANPDLILLDVVMPELDGLQTCKRLKQESQTAAIPVIFITGRDSSEDIIAGFEAGGVDYVVKPFREEEVVARAEAQVRLNRLTAELAASNRTLAQKNEELAREISERKALRGQLNVISQREAERWGLDGFVGESPTLQGIFTDIQLMRENPATSVLITGERGTGKEVIARAIHFGGVQSEGPFVPVNCGAIPGELVESALFGHVRGAFTGASEDRPGYFEIANRGTLFLDEIGDMPLQLQGKLLRVLEDGAVWPVGAKEGKQVAVRVLAATNADLSSRIDSGGFRQDLYYRLARFTVVAPPLRERKEDIPLLARHFLRLFAAEMGRETATLTPTAEQRLGDYDFPGNVRELKNIVERALIESGGEEITLDHLHFAAAPAANKAGIPAALTEDLALDPNLLDLDLAVQQAEQAVVKRAIATCNGNVSQAARLLGTSRNRIYRILGTENPEA